MWEMLCYTVGRSRTQCLKNISLKLVEHNVVCAKLFQALSVGINVLTKEESTFLSQYTDSVPFTKTEQKDLDELSRCISTSYNKQFKITKEPCNSGVIALVYKGNYGNQPVIIKVKRNGIAEKVDDGLMKMKTLVWFFKFIPWLNTLNLESVLEENIADIKAQCDFRNEVENAVLFKNKHKRLNYVKIPDVYPEITDIDSDVIVMELIEGIKINDIPEEHKSAYGSILATFVMKCVLYDGFYHGDLHSGNMLFLGNPEAPVIGIFDFGIMGRLSEDVMEGFYNFFKAGSIDKNYKAATNAVTNQLVSDPSAYHRLDIRKKNMLQDSLSIITQDMFNTFIDPSIVMNINSNLWKYGLSLSKDFCKVQLSMGVTLGVAAELSNGVEGFMLKVNEAVQKLIGDL